jgi:hypothetical protein
MPMREPDESRPRLAAPRVRFRPYPLFTKLQPRRLADISGLDAVGPFHTTMGPQV